MNRPSLPQCPPRFFEMSPLTLYPRVHFGWRQGFYADGLGLNIYTIYSVYYTWGGYILTEPPSIDHLCDESKRSRAKLFNKGWFYHGLHKSGTMRAKYANHGSLLPSRQVQHPPRHILDLLKGRNKIQVISRWEPSRKKSPPVIWSGISLNFFRDLQLSLNWTLCVCVKSFSSSDFVSKM